MNKVLLAVVMTAVGVVVGVLGYNHFRCKDPSKFEIVMTQLRCAQAIDSEEFKRDGCLRLQGTAECEFVEEDQKVLTDIFFEHINKCARISLKEQKLCVDKYEDM